MSEWFLLLSQVHSTLQPHHIGQKLLQMNVKPHLMLFILSLHQTSRFNGHQSSIRIISTGAPQGSVSSLVLLTLYTDDVRSSDPEMLYIKYSGDKVIIDTTSFHSHIREEMDRFADWCLHNLDLNPRETKQMIVEYRRHQFPIPSLQVNGK